jgi:hydrogenase expression/formation protein HypC
VCLAIPGKIIVTVEKDGVRMGRVQFGGISRLVSLDLVPEAEPGDFVLVHVGYAISRLDTEEAERTFRLLEEMGLLEAEGLDMLKTSSVK